ncbi:MAG: MauE/DoxX family redox-associated membrane protein [Solirubrobacterales bacterium]
MKGEVFELIIRAAAASLLAGSAIAKMLAAEATRNALTTFGINGPRLRALLWSAVVAIELGLAAGILAGSSAAAYAASALMIGFAIALVAALRAGRAGMPCGCLGRESTVGPVAVARNVGLAAAFAFVPAITASELESTTWLTIGLVLAFVLIVGMGVALAALARELGELRMRIGPEIALDIDGEGPPVGSATELADLFDPGPEGRLLLAIFSSRGCAMCGALEPSVDMLAGDPLIAVARFDEVDDSEVWQRLNIPGSPYAVVLSLDAAVLTKGTFNSLGQLQGLLAAAGEQRQPLTGVLDGRHG